MRQLGKKRRSIGIRGQMMWFLCLICLLLLGLFWFLSTQLLEPLYTKHIQKQLTAEAEMIVAEMDDAIAKGEILSYWAFGGIKVTNDDFFSQLGSDIYSSGELSSFCVDISDATLRTIKKYENLSYCSLHQKSFPDTLDDDIAYSTARQVRQYCRENGAFARVLPAAKPSAYNQLVVGRMTADGAYTVLVSTTLMHVSEAGEVMSTVLPLAAALIFVFAMSAAWLFSEWFTKPLRQLSRWPRAIMPSMWKRAGTMNLATWPRISTTWRRKSSGPPRCSGTCWPMSPTTCAPRSPSSRATPRRCATSPATTRPTATSR